MKKCEEMGRKTAKSIIVFSIALVCMLAMPFFAQDGQAAKVRLNKKSIILRKGKSKVLKIKGTKKKVIWKSKNKKIAKVNKKGKATAKKVGKTEIVAKVGKKKYICKVKVIKAKKPIEQVLPTATPLPTSIATAAATPIATSTPDLGTPQVTAEATEKVIRTVKVGIPADTQDYLKQKLRSTGAIIVELTDVVSGLSVENTKIMVVEATEDNLKALNDNKPKVDAYVNDGGWIIFTNLTDDEAALAEYNALLGTQHIVRPFRLEKTEAYEDWITEGVLTEYYTLYSKKTIAAWADLQDISPYTWSYAVDATNDITPFFDYEAYGDGNMFDNETAADRRYNAANICNNLSTDEHWCYQASAWINSYDLPTANNPLSFDTAFGVDRSDVGTGVEFFTLKQKEALESITYRQPTSDNLLFSGMNVIVDGEKVVDDHEIELVGTVQTIPLNGVKAKSLDIQFTGYYEELYDPSWSMVGIEELHINRQTPQWIIDSNCKALNSSGTLVKYARGNGGFLLNNIRLDTDTAEFSTNELSTSIVRKVNIFAKILENLGAEIRE